MNKEIWKPILGYEGLYEISNLSNIRSLCNKWGNRLKPRLVKQQLTKKGYMRVPLNKNSKHKQYMVHRLVYEAFNGKIDENMEINHIDYNRTNNNINNLQVMTHTDNVRYSKSKKVNQYDVYGNFIKQWDCIRDIERKLNIDHRQVSDNCKGKQKSCHGFIFKYKEE